MCISILPWESIRKVPSRGRTINYSWENGFKIYSLKCFQHLSYSVNIFLWAAPIQSLMLQTSTIPRPLSGLEATTRKPRTVNQYKIEEFIFRMPSSTALTTILHCPKYILAIQEYTTDVTNANPYLPEHSVKIFQKNSLNFKSYLSV
jgi:hypothetical protein